VTVSDYFLRLVRVPVFVLIAKSQVENCCFAIIFHTSKPGSNPYGFPAYTTRPTIALPPYSTVFKTSAEIKWWWAKRSPAYYDEEKTIK